MLVNNIDFNNPVRSIKGKVELLNSGSTLATKSGNPVIIDDAIEQPHDVIVSGLTEGAEVKRYGKNLIPYPYNDSSNYTTCGVNYIDNGDGTITIKGKPTAYSMYFIRKAANTFNNDIADGATYSMSLFILENNGEALPSFNGQINNKDGTVAKYIASGSSFTVDKSKYNYSYLRVQATDTTKYYDCKVGIQFELNNTITEFEPYTAPQTAIADSTGKAIVKSLAPNMTIFAEGTNITATYQKPVVADNHTFTYDRDLVSVDLERLGESAFFGYGVMHKASIHALDSSRNRNITTDNYAKIYFDDLCITPPLYITEVNRNENTNELSITAYDAIKKADNHTTAEITLISYTIGEYAAAIAAIIGVGLELPALAEFDLLYENGANLEGTETLRETLNDIAEATQTIYFINNKNNLVFKRLDKDGEPVITIDKSNYYSLDSSTNRRLAAICSATELGDNLIAELEISGTTQYVRDNAFWDLREDRTELVNAALEAVGGFTINQFYCDWRGNYLIEIGDKIGLEAKDGSLVYSYLLNDAISYNGAFGQITQWEYTDTDALSANPTNIGEAIKYTYAKVDKQEKQIDIVASEAAANKEAIGQIQVNTNSINASITEISNNMIDGLAGVNSNIEELTNRVSATMTAGEVKIEVETQLAIVLGALLCASFSIRNSSRAAPSVITSSSIVRLIVLFTAIAIHPF